MAENKFLGIDDSRLRTDMTAQFEIPIPIHTNSRKCYEELGNNNNFIQGIVAGLTKITENHQEFRNRIPKVKISLGVLMVLFASLSTPALAATAVFGTSVFSTTGPVTNPTNAVGAADGVGSVVGDGGSIVLQFDEWLLGNVISVNTVANGFVAFGTVSIGHVVNGVAVFSAGQNFNTLFNPNPTFDFSTQCAAISVNGCSLLQIQTTGTFFSTGISLDGVVGSAPEPATWMMMIFGFLAVAFRLKQMKRNSQPIIAARSPI